MDYFDFHAMYMSFIILQGIFEELMLNFYESPEKIVGFLEIISEYDNNQKGNFRTQEQVVSILYTILYMQYSITTL